MHKKNNQKGAVLIISILFFVVISLVLVIGMSSSVTREYLSFRGFDHSKEAYYLAESGNEDIFYRTRTLKTYDPETVLSIGSSTATTTVTTIGNEKSILSVANVNTSSRKVKSSVVSGTIASFNYGAQVGAGGIELQGSSTVNGSLFSVGDVNGTGSFNTITGTVISSGTSGSNGTITKIQNSGGSHMYAGEIANSVISGTPYCVTISGSTPNSCPSFTPIAIPTFPISDATVLEWQANATSGGIDPCTAGNLEISGGTSSLGPYKVPCDLKIKSGAVVNLLGPVWVTGKVEIESSGTTINVDASLGGASVAIIADPGVALRATGGKIGVEGGAEFNTTGNPDAHVMLLSWNTNPLVEAIEIKNTVSGKLITYAGYGQIVLGNSNPLAQVTGYKLTLKSPASVIYPATLQSTLFTSGGTSWTRTGWNEAQ